MESPSPTITVSIQTSSPTLNLTVTRPFVIKLTLRLHHSSSITFRKDGTGLFDWGLLYDAGPYRAGVTFTNTVTGKRVPPKSICILFEGGNHADTLTFANRNDFITLFPGQDHIIEETLRPTLCTPFFQASGMTYDKISEKQNSLPKVWKWPHVAGFEDGQTYEINISNETKVDSWREGSIGWLLMTRMLGMEPELRREVISYTVAETARFGVVRTDQHGSSNWP